MTYPVFPTLYAYSVNKKPTFKTLVQTPRSGRETTHNQRILPLWEFELRAEILRDETQNQVPATYFDGYTDLQQVMGLFLACGGQFGWFYFDDPSDNSRSEQGIATGDGAETVFRLLRTITYGSLTFTEPVGGINLGESITVFVDGAAVSQPGNWSISTDGLYLVFVVAPTAGAVIQISFSYYYLCHFTTDDIDFEQFMWNRWSTKSIRFRSTNPSELGAPLDANPLIPPPHPDPPPTTPPDIDGDAHGRLPISANNPLTMNLGSDNSSKKFLTTVQQNDVILVAIASGTSQSATARTVSSVTSSSGISFTRLQNTSQTFNGFGFGLELWSGRASLPLTNENIFVTFSAGVGAACISAAAISDANLGVFEDSGVSPPAVDAQLSPAFPNVTVTTTNQYDLLFWVSGGPGVSTNSPPAGFTSIVFNGTTTFHTSVTISMYISYKRVSAIQSSVNFSPNVTQGTGMCILAAVRN